MAQVLVGFNGIRLIPGNLWGQKGFEQSNDTVLTHTAPTPNGQSVYLDFLTIHALMERVPKRGLSI